MVIIGRIEAPGGIESGKWLDLIESHPALANAPTRKGVNPFTRQPCEYKPPASSALIRKDGAEIGSIYCAMDGSPTLVVQAQEDLVDAVAGVAADIAGSLGGHFVRQQHGE